MAASVSGILTLFIVLLIGPVCAYLYFRFFHHHVVAKADEVKRSLNSLRNSAPTARPKLLTQATKMRVNDELEASRSSTAVLFGLVGFAIGIGNVYRFPFVIAANGGGTALIIYIICLVLVAYPLFFFEMVAGYAVSKTPIETLTIISPRWTMLAVGQALMLLFQMGYFSAIMSYSLIFLVGSCQDPMPWTAEAQGTDTDIEAAQKYWYGDVLNKFTTEELKEREPGDLGGFNGSVVGAIFFTWLLTFMAMVFGKELVDKISRVTVIGPVVLMIVMVAAANTLPGSSDGIAFYIGKIDPSAFGKIEVWATCLGQVLFSLGPGYGVGMSYAATLEDPKVNIAKLCAIVAVTNAAFSIFSGFFTFAVVGHIAYETNQEIQDVTDEAGQGLVFAVAPVAMQSFGSMANVMSVLFYLMLFALGVDSIFAFTESIAAFLEGLVHMSGKEEWTHSKYFRFGITFCICFFVFLSSIPYASQLSSYIMNVVDYFTNTLGLLFANGFVSLALNFDFKYARVIETMKGTGNSLSKWYGRPTFHFFAPVGSIFLAIYMLVNTITDPFPWFNDIPRLVNIGWALFGIQMACFVGTLWRCVPSSLPPLLTSILDDEEVDVKELESYENPGDEEVNDKELESIEEKTLAETENVEAGDKSTNEVDDKAHTKAVAFTVD